MPYHVQTIEGVVRLTLSGRLTGADLSSVATIAEEIEALADVSPNRITDATPVEGIAFDFSAIEMLAKRRRCAPLKNPIRSAIVAPKAFLYGFARMFQTLNDNPKIDLEVFRNLEEAVTWIGDTEIDGELASTEAGRTDYVADA